MKKLIVAAAAALFLAAPMAACTTVPTGGVFEQTLVDEKALYAAEAAYFGAATAAEAGADAGVLRGETAALVAGYLQTAYDALLVARQAQAAGNTADAHVAAAKVLGAVSAAQKLLNPRPG